MTDESVLEKETFSEQAQTFLSSLFSKALEQGLGEIELRTFKPVGQYFVRSVNGAAEKACECCGSGVDVYVGVNPRVGRGGKKENVEWLTAFHAEVDYGEDGHKKPSLHKTYNDALTAIEAFPLTPTLIVHSGGGFHAYWVLREPVKVGDVGISQLEAINSALCQSLGGDSGTQDISRVLRVPGTYNFKIKESPRKVEFVAEGPMYDYGDFANYSTQKPATQPQTAKRKEKIDPEQVDLPDDEGCSWDGSVDTLQVSQKIKHLILNGNDGSYPSRSEADLAVAAALVYKGVSDADIVRIFKAYPIGEKYRGHPGKKQYLDHTLAKAKTLSGLTEAERLDPLFLTGSLVKRDNTVTLDVPNFQEYVSQKHHLTNVEGTFYRYKDHAYAPCSETEINALCQEELGKTYRKHFTLQSRSSFLHFAESRFRERKDVEEALLKYMAFTNGIFDFSSETFHDHTPEIFTTSRLPYEYDRRASCPRWERFLVEVSEADMTKISLMQEAVGYCFHRTEFMPAAIAFCLIGEGRNGKSVFLNVLQRLFGKENCCTVKLSDLSKEFNLNMLRGKIVNIVNETPERKLFDTDLFKAVTSGDMVSARKLYGDPSSFQPFAKHFFAMNRFPVIQDTTLAFWKRIKIIEFPHVFEGDAEDVHLTEKLITELPGIWNWAYEGYKRLRNNKFQFTDSRGLTEVKKRYREASDATLQFCKECLKKEKGHEVVLKEAYERFRLYCQENGFRDIPTKPQFMKTLQGEKLVIRSSTRQQNKVTIRGHRLVG